MVTQLRNKVPQYIPISQFIYDFVVRFVDPWLQPENDWQSNGQWPKKTANHLLYAFREYDMSLWFDVVNIMYRSECVYHHKFNLDIIRINILHTYVCTYSIHTTHIQTWAMRCSFLWAPGNDIASPPLGAETSTSVG